MIEVFSGTATLCAVSKEFGMQSSLALDKVKKKGARATVCVFNLLNPADRDLLYNWIESPLLAWVHFAPVCGTCSRARQIPNGGPPPLRSDDFPMGLPHLKKDLKGAEWKRPTGYTSKRASCSNTVRFEGSS